MVSKRIAIVGSSDPTRTAELGTRNEALAKQAGEFLGTALAKKGINIVVYSSTPHMFEVDVVRGYLSVPARQPASIQVLYSDRDPQPKFTDDADKAVLFDTQADLDENWEVAFYRSIGEVDGIILLGGGSSTLIAGIVAIGHQKPMLAFAAYGGAARKVYEVMRGHNYPIDQNDYRIMAQSNWNPEQAERIVEVLERQLTQAEQNAQDQLKKLRREIEGETKEKQIENSTVTFYAIVAIVCILLGGLYGRQLLAIQRLILVGCFYCFSAQQCLLVLEEQLSVSYLLETKELLRILHLSL